MNKDKEMFNFSDSDETVVVEACGQLWFLFKIEKNFFFNFMVDDCCILVLDFNECNAPTSPCHLNAICKNNEGSYVCSCLAGYTGNGKTCTGNVTTPLSLLVM